MKPIPTFVIGAALLLGLGANAYAQSFEYFRELTATNSSATAQSNVPVPLRLTDANFDFSNVRGDGLDIRFSSDTNPATFDLDYFLEFFDDVEEEALFWINLPSIDATDTATFYMFYGDASFAVDDSDRDATFPNRWISGVDGPTIDATQVHEYDWFEVEDGDQVTLDPPGDVLTVRAARILVDGTIRLDGQGHAGGDAEEDGEDDGNTGGGGEPGATGGTPPQITGAGGGGYGGEGGDGGDAAGPQPPASGGNAYDAFAASGLGVELGSGGGGGVTGVPGTAEGGAGAAAIDARAMLLTMTQGTITANGSEGNDGETGGGGGAGGGILIGGYHLRLVNPTLEARGGDGGNGGAAGGGGGGGGIIRVVYQSELDETNLDLVVDGGAGGILGVAGDDGDDGEEVDFQDADVIDEILVTDVGAEQLFGAGAQPPVLTVTHDGSPVSEDDTFEVATGSSLAELNVAISVSDPNNLDVDVETTLDPAFADFDPNEWEVTGASTDPFSDLQPGSGTFTDNAHHEITITAENTDGARDSLTFFIFVGPRFELRRDGHVIEFEDTDDAGTIPDTQTLTLSYQITNAARGPLELTGDPPIEIVDTDNADVLVSQQPSTTIAASATTTFELLIIPDSTGEFEVEVRIGHNALLDAPFEFTIEGEAEPTPSLTLIDPLHRELIPANAHFIGYLQSYAPQTIEYTIRNDGGEDLELDDPSVAVAATENVTAEVTMQPTSLVLEPSEEATFVLELEPVPSGPFSFTLTLGSNDPQRPSYIAHVEGWATTIPQSRPQIERPATRTIPSRGTHDVGFAITGDPQAYSFTVRNIGVEELNLADLEVGEAENANVTITAQPSVSELAYGETTSFEIEVTPLEDGPWQMSLTLPNDSPMLPGYWIRVVGEGVATGRPAIAVERHGNVLVPHEGSDDIGERPAGEASVVVYWIRNRGTEPLTVEWPVTISEADNVAATVLALPANNVPAIDGLTPIVVALTPDAPDRFSFDVTVESDDPEQPSYRFTVRGNAPFEDPDGIQKFMGGCATGAGAHAPLALIAAVVLLALLRRRTFAWQ